MTATTRPQRRSASPPPAPPPYLPNDCDSPELAAAAARIGDGLFAIAASIDNAADTAKPIADFLEDAGDRLDKLCAFLKSKWPLLVGGALAVASASNAISPNAAAALKAAISVFTGAAGG